MGYGSVEIIGFIAGGIGVGFLLPQLLHIMKSKTITGVSYGMWFFTMVAYVSWWSYAIRVDSASQFYVNIITICLSLILLSYMLKQNNKLNLINILLIIVVPLVFGISVMYLPLVFVGVLLAAFDFSRILQIRKSWGSFKNAVYSDVSISSHVLSIISAGGWLIYGIITGLWVNILIASLIITYSTIIIVLEFLARRKHEVKLSPR